MPRQAVQVFCAGRLSSTALPTRLCQPLSCQQWSVNNGVVTKGPSFLRGQPPPVTVGSTATTHWTTSFLLGPPVMGLAALERAAAGGAHSRALGRAAYGACRCFSRLAGERLRQPVPSVYHAFKRTARANENPGVRSPHFLVFAWIALACAWTLSASAFLPRPRSVMA